jgi:hypothetical protein
LIKTCSIVALGVGLGGAGAGVGGGVEAGGAPGIGEAIALRKHTKPCRRAVSWY